jgi:hypothetical protein
MDDATGSTCDRCGARARYTYTGHGSIDLCRHHSREHDRALRRAGFERRDVGLVVATGAVR